MDTKGWRAAHLSRFWDTPFQKCYQVKFKNCTYDFNSRQNKGVNWAAVKPPPASEGVSFGLNLFDKKKVEKDNEKLKNQRQKAKEFETPLKVKSEEEPLIKTFSRTPSSLYHPCLSVKTLRLGGMYTCRPGQHFVSRSRQATELFRRIPFRYLKNSNPESTEFL